MSDRRGAIDYFTQAGECYGRVGNPYALLMFAFAEYSPSDLLGRAEAFGFLERKPAERLQMSYLLLAAAAGDWGRDLLGPLHDELHGSRTSPIGVLGLPVGAYLDLTRALGTGEMDAVLRTLVPFLLAHSTAVSRARDDHYHWGMLALPFHPAEPDILSVMFLVEAAVRMRGEKLLYRVLRMVPLLPESADLLYNAISERFGDLR